MEILRGRSKRRRREPTAAEFANERRFYYELAELMEEGVLVDRFELVPEVAENDQVPHRVGPAEAQELW